MDSLCLFCASSCPIKFIQNDGRLSIFKNEKDDNHRVDNSLLPSPLKENVNEELDGGETEGGSERANTELKIIKENLKSIFILTNLLNYPRDKLGEFLGSFNGQLHPELWFSICTECDEVVEKSLGIYNLISKLEGKLNVVRDTLKQNILESRNQDDLSTTDQPTDGIDDPLGKIWNAVRSHVVAVAELPTQSKLFKDCSRPATRKRKKQSDPQLSTINGEDTITSDDKDDLKANSDKDDDAQDVLDADWAPDHSPASVAKYYSSDSADDNFNNPQMSHPERILTKRKKYSKSQKTKSMISVTKKRDFKRRSMKSNRKSIITKKSKGANTLSLQPSEPTKHLMTYPPPPKPSKEYTRRTLTLEEFNVFPKVETKLQHLQEYFKCNSCPAFYIRKEHIEYHFNIHRKNSGVPCQLCGWTIRNHAHFIEHHMTKHHSTKSTDANTLISSPVKPTLSSSPPPLSEGYARRTLTSEEFDVFPKVKTKLQYLQEYYKCKSCPAFYVYKKHINIHVKIHRKNAGSPCQFCGWVIHNNPRHIELHMTKHHSTKATNEHTPTLIPQAEPEKEAESRTSSPLSNEFTRRLLTLEEYNVFPHQLKTKLKHLQKFFKCNSCPAFYLRQENIEYHLNIHRKNIGIPCQLCNWLIRNNQHHIELHMTKHHLKPHCDLQESNSMKKIGVFKCPTCGALNTERKWLARHKKLHETGTGYHCPDCSWLSSSLNNHKHMCPKSPSAVWKHRYDNNLLRYIKFNHSHSCSEDAPYYCDLCPFMTMNITNVDRHYQSIHSSKTRLKCDDDKCESTFSSLQLLQIHTRDEHGKPIDPPEVGMYACTHCPESFDLKQKLDLHTLKRHRSRIYDCSICGSQAGNAFRLAEHMQNHTGVNQHACELCDKSFKGKFGLLQHKRSVHPKDCGLQPLICPECGLSFGSTGGLNTHIKRVHGSNEDVCPHCGQSFSNSWSLNKHIQVVHSSSSTQITKNFKFNSGFYVCDICGDKFKKIISVKVHMKKFHGYTTEYKCKGCQIIFKGPRALGNHAMTCSAANEDSNGKDGVMLKCSFCPFESRSKYKLLMHKRKEHAEQFLRHFCPHCGMGFTTPSFVNRHEVGCSMKNKETRSQ